MKMKHLFFGQSNRRFALGLLLLSISAFSLRSGLANSLASNSYGIDTLPVNKVVATINLTANISNPTGIAVSSDNKTVYVCDPSEFAVWVIDASTNQVTGKIVVGLGEEPQVCAVTPDGLTLYVQVGNGRNDIAVISTASKSVYGAFRVRSFSAGDVDSRAAQQEDEGDS